MTWTKPDWPIRLESEDGRVAISIEHRDERKLVPERFPWVVHAATYAGLDRRRRVAEGEAVTLDEAKALSTALMKAWLKDGESFDE